MNMTSKNPFKKELEDMIKKKSNSNSNNQQLKKDKSVKRIDDADSKYEKCDDKNDLNCYDKKNSLNWSSKTLNLNKISKPKIKAPILEKPNTNRTLILKDSRNTNENINLKSVNPDKIKSKVENQFRNSRFNKNLN